jgi:hypothetical protein
MSRAQNILWENRDTIEQMMQQMDDFADANGGYINKSGVGNFRTQPKVEEEDKKKEPMSKGRRQARAAGLGTAGLGAAYLATRHGSDASKDAVIRGLSRSGAAGYKALKTASSGEGVTGSALRAAGKGIKTAYKHYSGN